METLNLGVKNLTSSKELMPSQTVTIPANISGTILLANNGQSQAEGKYKLTISGQTTEGNVPPNGSKLVTYSSAQDGVLQNTGSVTLSVSIS